MKLKHVLAGWCVGLAFAGVSQAAVITWGPVQNTSGASDVVTTGSTVLAENVGYNSANPGGLADTVTVNGVTFTGSDSAYGIHTYVTGQTTPYATLSSPSGSSWSRYGLFGGSSATWNSFSSDYKKLVGQGLYFQYAANRKATLKFYNLIVGQVYDFQYWVCDGRSNDLTQVTRLAESSDPLNYVDLYANGSSGNKMPGQFVTGTFVADSTGTQSITIALGSTGGAMLNAYQLRAIPEPASLALLGLGSVMTASRRARTADAKR